MKIIFARQDPPRHQGVSRTAIDRRDNGGVPVTNRYVLTADGIRIAVFYTMVYNRLLSR